MNIIIATEMSAEKSVTLSKVIPTVFYLIKYLSSSKVSPVTHTASLLKETLISSLEERFKLVEESNVAVIATIFDPRFKKINIKSGRAIAIALDTINKLIPSSPPPQPTESSDEGENNDLLDSHEEYVTEQHSRPTRTRTGFPSKLKMYLDAENRPLETSPLQFWSEVKTGYWEIAETAGTFLSIPRTSVPS